MSKPIGETLNEVVGGDEVARAEAQAKACVEAARQRLVLTRGGLGEVRQSLAALLALTGSTDQVSSRRIEGLLWELKAMVQALSLLTEQSEVDLGRVVPELRAMVQATTKAAPAAPTRIVLKLGSNSESGDGVKAWPEISRRPTGLKN